ncbi:MBL fold metallo-hydrolase [Pelagicoccus enzymogenes]|uniref:MBL fold metallo-hydrolase n=1 Tax=Pelagicoccus enzymogenes TaxID=2773457 RepID=UPI003CE51BE3
MNSIECVRFFAAGCCSQKEALSVRGSPWRDVGFPALCSIFRHPQLGWVLYDTGYDPEIGAATASFSMRLYARVMNVDVSRKTSVVAGLAKLGLRPEDISLVVLSHFHPDHIGGARLFAKSRFLCSRVGYESVLRHPRRLGFRRDLLPDDFEARCDYVEDLSMVSDSLLSVFGKVYDLFGDGEVRCVLIDGHAPRQVACMLGGPDAACFLVSDAAWSSQAISRNCPPSSLTRWIHDDWKTLLENLEKLHRLALSHPNWKFVPSHCRVSLEEAECRLARSC